MDQEWEVIVSNVGCVYKGKDSDEASAIFEEYVAQSKTGLGRAGGESVALIEDGFIICSDFIGANDEDYS